LLGNVSANLFTKSCHISFINQWC